MDQEAVVEQVLPGQMGLQLLGVLEAQGQATQSLEVLSVTQGEEVDQEILPQPQQQVAQVVEALVERMQRMWLGQEQMVLEAGVVELQIHITIPAQAAQE